MDLGTGHDYTPLRKSLEADADPNATPGVKQEPKAVVHDAEIQEPLQNTQSSYRAISTVRSAIPLGSIIITNCFCSSLLCLCLWGFSRIDNLNKLEKRGFNALSLLLSATLGFGIGLLCDKIGFLARGKVLQSKSHSVEEVGYIIRGTLSAYASLFIHQFHTRKGLVSFNTWVLFLFLLCSVIGRFGVAFLGFAFNLEDSPNYIPRLFMPDWGNGTVGGNDSIEMALASELGLPANERSIDMGRAAFANADMASILFQLAQTAKGLPWFLPRNFNTWPYLNHTQATSYAMNISHFSTANLSMEVSGDNTVSFRYKFREFLGTTAVLTGSEALWETRCQEFVPSQNGDIPLQATKDSGYASSYRWIFPTFPNQLYTTDVLDDGYRYSHIYRNATLQLWLLGQSAVFHDQINSTNPLVTQQSYLADKSILFNCSLYIDSGMIATRIHDFLTLSIVFPYTLIEYMGEEQGYIHEHVRSFNSTLEFDFGVSRQNRTASAIWLSAYIGNYIGNCLSFLNEFLRRIEIEPEKNTITTKLFVKWERVAATLGALAGFQVLFGLSALLYCRRGFEIVDDVSTLSYMFADFPFRPEEQRQKEGLPPGKFKFVPEGHGFRWVFVAGAGKDIKVE